MKIILIDPYFSDIQQAESYYDDSLKCALESFYSAVWRQGWGADERVLEEYGKWLVYGMSYSDEPQLFYKGVFKELWKELVCKD